MNTPTKADVKKILGALKRSNKKVVSLESLSRLVGLYPDVLGEKLSYFSPMILMDPSINTRDLVPELEAFIEEPIKKNEDQNKQKKVIVRKKELLAYSSISDFIYKKMTSVGGLVDQTYVMTDEDLAALAKLVKLEQDKRHKKNKKRHK